VIVPVDPVMTVVAFATPQTLSVSSSFSPGSMSPFSLASM